MLIHYVPLLLAFSSTLAYHLNLDPQNAAASGWENIFARNHSSVIPLLHYGQKSYFMGIQAKATYMQAIQFCNNLHMQLLTIRSAEENERIRKYIREAAVGDEFWTSGSSLLDGRTWIWMSNGGDIDYTNWAYGQPSGHESHCLGVRQEQGGLYWYNINCNTQLVFICERYVSGGDAQSSGVWGATTQKSRWMNLLETASPNIGLLHYGDKSYFFSNNVKANYMQAIQFCKIIHMELVTITSDEENNRIRKYIRDTKGSDTWWTAGSKLLDGQTWVWMTKGTTIDYTNWLAGQPFGNNQHCLHLIHQQDEGLFWSGNYCSSQFNVICERSTGDEALPPIDIRYLDGQGAYSGGSRCDATPPTVNVYVSNNVITEEGKSEASQSFLTSENVDVTTNGGYHVEVNNVFEPKEAPKSRDRYNPLYIHPEQE